MQAHPLSYNAESLAETFGYVKFHHFYLQGYPFLLHTTLLNVGGDCVPRLLHKEKQVFQDFWQYIIKEHQTGPAHY